MMMTRSCSLFEAPSRIKHRPIDAMTCSATASSSRSIKILFNVWLLVLMNLSLPQTASVSHTVDELQPSSIGKLSDWLLSERSSSTDSADLLAKRLDFQTLQPDIAAGANSDINIDDYRRSSCQLVPVMHVLHQPGCHTKAIDSFACIGSCSSYVQVSRRLMCALNCADQRLMMIELPSLCAIKSNTIEQIAKNSLLAHSSQVSSSKFWQRERSCSCCQQTGLKEATFTLDCPSLNPPYRKVRKRAVC